MRIKDNILNKLISFNLSKRELKILLLIIKNSKGKNYAILSKRDFAKIGILPYHVDELIDRLVLRNIISVDRKRCIFKLNDTKEWIDYKLKYNYYAS